MKRLEALVHPLVGDERRRFVDSNRDRGCPLVVLDIPLLYETHAEGSVDGVLVVSAPPEVPISRLGLMAQYCCRPFLKYEIADMYVRFIVLMTCF